MKQIDFEQELYKAFGQIKDFTLGVAIAKRFYDMGKNSQEPVSEVWHDSNNEQPKDLRTVVILNPEEKSGEVLQRCLCVYENRILAYLEDILPT